MVGDWGRSPGAGDRVSEMEGGKRWKKESSGVMGGGPGGVAPWLARGPPCK